MENIPIEPPTILKAGDTIDVLGDTFKPTPEEHRGYATMCRRCFRGLLVGMTCPCGYIDPIREYLAVTDCVMRRELLNEIFKGYCHSCGDKLPCNCGNS